MEPAVALESLAGGEVDDDLIQAIQALSESTANGGRRYEPRVVRVLVQLIAGRAYGRTLLELSHLLALAERAGGRQGAVGFFWGVEQARRSAFQQILTLYWDDINDAGLDIHVEADGVAIRYADGGFLVHFGRMPLLAALFELLVTTIGFDAVTAAAKVMTQGMPSSRAAAACSNDLSRLLYDYLRGRLPSAQHHRQHRRLVDHMGREKGGAFGIEDIDDASVLKFWEWAADRHAKEPTEVKSFRTIVVAFIQFRRAMQAVLDRRAVDGARSIGSDRESGEVDPEILELTLDCLEEERDRVAELLSAPLNAVKFLNKRESDRLDLVGRHGEHGKALALSVLRAGLFGDMQGRLTEARRRRKGVSETEALISEGPSESYDDRLRDLHKLSNHLENCRLAALHVLALHQEMAALGLLIDLFPDLDLGMPAGQRSWDGDAGVIPIQARRLLRALAEGLDPVVPVAAQAAKAFATISRQGFSNDAVSDPAHAVLFGDAAPALAVIQRDVNDYLTRVEDLIGPEGSAGLLARDRTIFAASFRTLYGSQS
jgi:hypothetical protein